VGWGKEEESRRDSLRCTHRHLGAVILERILVVVGLENTFSKGAGGVLMLWGSFFPEKKISMATDSLLIVHVALDA
jgi:hypothetical protein